MYGKLAPEVLHEIREKIGGECIIHDSEKLQSYARDESGLVYLPDIVIEPKSTRQVQDIMAWATRHRIPVTPRAAASNVTGGALAVEGGIILSVMKMNRILEIDKRNLLAITEPGVITYNLQRAVEEQDLYYPPDPSSIETSTIAGNVAENAGGAHCLKYGTTKDYVLGLTIVLPDGRLLRTGGKTRKGVVGYDLNQLFIGSEGTLGVITEVILRLLPKPKDVVTLLALFENLETAMSAAASILEQGFIPAAMDLMRGNAFLPEGARKRENVNAILLIEVDGSPSALEGERDEIGAISLEKNALDVLVVEGGAKRKALWDKRRRSFTDLVERMAVVESLDPVVPLDKIDRYVHEVELIKEKYGIEIYYGGHAGDGNVHTNLASKNDNEVVRSRMKMATEEILSLALSLGGTIAGEHGIGFTKKKHVPMELSETSIEIQRGLKHFFDPLNIMNPGKILPDARDT